jgi:hypothetical protein
MMLTLAGTWGNVFTVIELDVAFVVEEDPIVKVIFGRILALEPVALAQALAPDAPSDW